MLDRRMMPALLALLVLLTWTSPLGAVTRSWDFMTTGNGHGFQIFDRSQHRIKELLEHPYRYVAMADSEGKSGVGRRNLAHDIYFGVRADGVTWLHDQTNVEYEAQTHIIHAWSSQGGVQTDTYYFAPFGYAGNGMIMLIRVTNTGGAARDVAVFAKPNLKLGSGRVDPGEENESIQRADADGLPYVTETGPGGGHAIYVPIGGADRIGCGADADVYDAIKGGADATDKASCSGAGQIAVFQKDLTLEAGQSATWGLAVLFLNDSPADPKANDFKDHRSVADILALWKGFVGEQGAAQVHQAALDEFEAWRTPSLIPPAIKDDPTELKLWRQSEAVLRMGQVREAPQSNRYNYGMYLAALPVGEWHTGWLRDGVYAIVAMAKLRHDEEAQDGIEFYLNSTAGIYSGANWLGADYRISTCRYFGNGVEEADWNHAGPNIETDGWGLALWGARMVLEYSCDKAWLDKPTRYGDTVFDGLKEVADDILEQIQGDLPRAEASIWEVHWDLAKVFTYTTACQIRGLFDFADICDLHGREDLAPTYRDAAQRMLDAMKTALVYQPTQGLVSHIGVAGDAIHVDGSTVEALSWDEIRTDDPIYMGTLNEYSKLETNFGGYRRLEPQLSITGEAQAGAYDLSEWILLDLRISDAWRRAGQDARAEELLDKITEHATANDFLVPELFDKDTGEYTGVVPMVGYGAGAWIMSQMFKYGYVDPYLQKSLDHCAEVEPPPDPVIVEGEEVVQVDTITQEDVPYDPYADTGSNPYDPPKDTTGGGGGGGGTAGQGDVDWSDGAASFCSAAPAGARAPWGAVWPSVMLLIGAMWMVVHARRHGGQPNHGRGKPRPYGSPMSHPETRRGEARLARATTHAPGHRHLVVVLVALLLAPPAALASVFNVPLTAEAETAEAAEAPSADEAWRLETHGYARMPVSWQGSPFDSRPAYLVSDNYYLSGWQYLRVNEADWAELFLHAVKGETRVVLGLFASMYSDWAEVSLSDQWGIAMAWVEHPFHLAKWLDLDVKAGMFRDAMGYIAPYDTYVFGRTHEAGALVNARLHLGDWRANLKLNYGAHKDLVSLNQGWTPVGVLGVGAGWRMLDLSFYYLTATTRDTEREYALIEEGDLDVAGVELRADAPYAGRFQFAFSHIKATRVQSLATVFELMHSFGSRGLTQNFFGPDSENGTGELQVIAFDWSLTGRDLLDDLGVGGLARWTLAGLGLRVFGMHAEVLSKQSSDDPLQNFNERGYWKWGLQPMYRLPVPVDQVFFALRYDRVVNDADHESRSFRAMTPILGLTVVEGVDVFLAYTSFSYGENVTLRPNQIPGDRGVSTPDDHAFKIQAQASW